MNNVEAFFELHKGPELLLIGNVWDAASAQLFERAGYKALATSSAALAETLGYEDGEHLPFELLLQTIQRILNRVSVPLSVDMERGYSSSIQGIIENVARLYDLGVVGMNIEDSVRDGGRSLQPMEDFSRMLDELSNHLARTNRKFFINARTDAFLTGHSSPLPETIKRAHAYENAGANGLFVPFAAEPEDIKAIVQSTSLPVHLLYYQKLPTYKELLQLGVRRVSQGTALYRSMMAGLEKHIRAIQEQQAFVNI
ncbi:MAG TPA: isocitrate lyase/phosphoenolpyruvate mutase family protein [Chitinophagaceae bacterium]|nr:isocitrate lyase/phosphoenolpyruvate mutase family protein [Chitinophagaceae bacterium]